MSDSPSHIAGKRIVLPSIYLGSPRFMTEIYHDAMGICKTYGFPYVFITFRSNSKWPEISHFVQSINLRLEDRPDILSRVFKINLDILIKELKNENRFGRVIACK